MAYYALGSDTGGSIRQPASLSGVVGLKPTYGRVSRYGLVAFASSLDQIGPFTRSVRDAALVFEAIAGPRRARLDLGADGCAGHRGRRSRRGPARAARRRADGVLRRRAWTPTVRDVGRRRRSTSSQSLGAEVDCEVSLPCTGHALAVYYIIAPSEASANLARYDGVKYGYSYHEGASMWENMEKTRQYGFGDEVKRRIMLGTYALSAGYYDAYYLKAQKVRTLIRREFDAAFEKHDVLVAPVTPTPAFKIGEKTDDPLQMYLSDVFTLPVNIAGLPGHLGAVRLRRRSDGRAPTGRPPGHRQAVRRGDAAPRGARLRAIDGVAPGAAGPVTPLRTIRDIPTPALILDVPTMERNIRRMAEFFAEGPTKLRPHFKAHKTPEIARRQLAAGSCVGLTCATVGEAEVAAGFCDDMLIANQVIGLDKCARVAILAKSGIDIKVAVDSELGLEQLSKAAQDTGTTVGVARRGEHRLPRGNSAGRAGRRTRAPRDGHARESSCAV